jgi:ubiquinone/menaquinone biosynthesis C-methylase UbiE
MNTGSLKKKITDENIDPLDSSVKTKWASFIPGMQPEHVERYKFAGRIAKSLSNPVLLDVGCGYGYGAKIIKDIAPKTNISAIDRNSSALEKAKSKYSNYANFIKGDIRKLPFKDNFADIVTCFEVTEHLEQKDQQNFINGLARVLKKDTGMLILSIPYPNATFKVGNKVFYGLGGSGFHKYEPSFKEMKTMLKNARLTNITEYGQEIVNSREAMFLSLVNKIIPIWGLYSWLPKRNHSVQEIPEGKTAIIGVFVAKTS